MGAFQDKKDRKEDRQFVLLWKVQSKEIRETAKELLGQGGINLLYSELAGRRLNESIARYFSRKTISYSARDNLIRGSAKFFHKHKPERTVEDWIERLSEPGKNENLSEWLKPRQPIYASKAEQYLNAHLEAEKARRLPALYKFLQREIGEGVSPPYAKLSKMWVRNVTDGRRQIDLPIPVSLLSTADQIALKESPPNPFFENKKDFAADQSSYLKQLIAINSLEADPEIRERSLHNGNTYTIATLENERSSCTIGGSASDYYSMLKHQAAPEYALLSALQEMDTAEQELDDYSTLIERRVEARKQSTHAAMSISALVVYPDARDAQLRAMVLKKDKRTAVYKDLWAVVPGGMFQPELGDPKEWNIHHCLIKEYCEELFGENPVERQAHPYFIYQEWQSAKDLYSKLVEGKCEIVHSGVALNLLNSCVEICCVILVKDADWFEGHRRRFKYNFEYVARSQAQGNCLLEYKVNSAEKDFLDWHESNIIPAEIAGSWVPGSLASFWLGIDAVRQNRPNRFVPFV